MKTALAKHLRQSIAANQRDGAEHLIVDAKAGTGKTTTGIEGLKILRGGKTSLTPSPQQEAIWDALKEGAKEAKTIRFAAFGKDIATELQERVPKGVDAGTMHSMGFRGIGKAFDRRIEVNRFRSSDTIADILEMNSRELRRKRPAFMKATAALVGLCKMNLTGIVACSLGMKVEINPDELDALATYYDVDLGHERTAIFDMVPKVLTRALKVDLDGQIDYADMIWLPIALDLPLFRYDLMLVDEAQDLNRCQQALAFKTGRRIAVWGDPRQAIYGFAGADAESMKRLQGELEADPRGCKTLPLTVTYRCGKAIVAEAQQIVPDYEAHASNPSGSVNRERLASYGKKVQPGDMIICRTNAPLVSQCFKFLGQGRLANIRGRQIGDGLVSLVNKLTDQGKEQRVPTLIGRLSDWIDDETEKEEAKKHPSDNRIRFLQDKHDCIVCFSEGNDSTKKVLSQIETIFTNDKKVPGIMLSSVHKAKGLEAKRVHILRTKDAPMPHPMARTKWEHEQEMNLLYVAITRAIDSLTYVTD